MTSSPSNSIAFQVPENVTFAKDQQQFLSQFTEIYRKLAKSSNSKDIGTYELTELINGQTFFGATPQIKRTIYRKCFAFGAIAAGATLNVAHGITPITFTRIYGTCITVVPDFRPIPRVSATLITDQIYIGVAGANIVIVNGATAPNIASGIVILEYSRN